MADAKIDRTMPEGKWEFGLEVTEAFDDMLRRSIPQHDVMRTACFEVGARFVRPDTDVVDLGCARGEALAPFVDRFGARCRYIGVEVSAPMRAAAEERFAGMVKTGFVRILPTDLRRGYPSARASLTLAVLTVQFVPIEHRPRLLADAFEATVPGGAIVLVEKILGADAGNDALFVDLYYGLKREHGYSEEAIERKRLSLEGVLVPVTARWNEDLLSAAGFRRVECFWRWMNFAAWLGVRAG